MAKKARLNPHQQGQATVETLISMLALLPIFILIPYIGKYIDIKSKAVQASRYAAFERTVFSDPGASWNSDENQKLDQQISRDINRRILSDPKTGVSSLNNGFVDDNPLWTNYRGDQLLAGRQVERLSAALAEGESPVDRTPLMDAITGRITLLIDLGLGLNKQSYAQNSVAITAEFLPDITRVGAAPDLVEAETRIAFLRTGAVLTDAWSAGSEDVFEDRIDGLTADEIIAIPVALGTFTFGFIPPFLEGIKGQDFGLESESTVVPPEFFAPLQ